MSDAISMGVMLGVLAVVVAIRTVIGAFFLRAAIALHNRVVSLHDKIVGDSSSDSVPEPPLKKAMGVIFATSLAQIVAGYVINVVVGGDKGGIVFEPLVFIPVGFLIMAHMLSVRLPTSFGRGLLVTLCYMLVELVVVAVFVGVAILVPGIAFSGA